MRLKNALVVISLLCSAAIQAQQLKLIPYPKEINVGGGKVTITSATRIALTAKHAKADRVAAEMLAEEIERTTGRKPAIGGVAPGAILLTRLEPKAGDDPLFKDQGYSVTAKGGKITVAGASDAGLFYGVQTLRQLMQPDGKKVVVPEVSIRDWPSMKWRGVHDDLSRGPIPKLDFLKQQIRTLSEYKINMFSPYMEAVFAYKNQPLAAPLEAAVTPEEARELVKYAASYYVTVVPEQEAFGHLHNILKYELYTDLAETPHGHVLAPGQEGSYSLIKDMFDQISEVYPGPFLHIGADETFELGRGQTKPKADEVGIGKVYLDFLARITNILKPHNKRIMFWGDIAMKYPQLLNILPKDVIAVAWSYSARPNFDNMLKPYKDNGLDLFVAPGANNWNVIFPNLDNAYPNISVFVRDGQKFGSLGMLNTNWNDDGESFIGLTWSQFVMGGACSWQPGECNIQQFEQAYDWAFYRNTDTTLHDAILALNKANTLFKGAGLGESSNQYLWIDPFSPAGAQFAGRMLPIAHDLRLTAETGLVSLINNRAKAKIHADTIEPLIVAGYRLDFLGMKVQYQDEMARAWTAMTTPNPQGRFNMGGMSEITGTNGRLEDLRDALVRNRRMYSEYYLKENHPYWIDNVLARYDNLTQIVQDKIQQVRAVRRGANPMQPPPSAEQMGFVVTPPPPRPAPGTPGAPPPQAAPQQVQPPTTTLPPPKNTPPPSQAPPPAQP
jgi:hexosaminidase